MYNKLFSKIVTSSIWMEPTPTRLAWITFLAVMDDDGFAPFASISNLAHTARLSLDEAKQAVTVLESPDADSGDPDNEGRRIERVPGGWIVLNAGKYRDLVTRQVAKEKTRERVARFRAKKACNADVTPANVLVTQSDAVSVSVSDAKNKKERSRFTPPTLDQVLQYMTTKGRPDQASKFFAYYESQGWKVGKNPMKNWEAAASGWLSRDLGKPSSPIANAVDEWQAAEAHAKSVGCPLVRRSVETPNGFMTRVNQWVTFDRPRQ